MIVATIMKTENSSKQTVEAFGSAISTRKLKYRLGIFIAVFSFALYAQSISFSYTLDDETCITKNKITSQGFHGIPTLLKTDYWYGYSDIIRVPEYRPASLILFATEWQFFPNNAHVGHLVNVLLYSLTCWLLFILLCELMEGQKIEDQRPKTTAYLLLSSIFHLPSYFPSSAPCFLRPIPSILKW